MKYHFVHISDLHFREQWEEDQGLLLREFISDLKKQVADYEIKNVYIVFTGDIVLAGANKKQYEDFMELISVKLDDIGITREQRICVPGNHDIDLNKAKNLSHKAILEMSLDEKKFNDYIEEEEYILNKKFSNYADFQDKFAKYNVSNKQLSGAGHTIAEDIAIYCMNSALSCGESSSYDHGRLRIDTRSLHKWNNQCNAKHKILIMHHPVSYLTDWAAKDISNIIEKDFSLLIHGHTHDQSSHINISSNGGKTIKCSAPPLLTNKHDQLGYAIFSISKLAGIEKITYRQWTKNHTFVPGVNFSNNETGIIQVINNLENLLAFDKNLLDSAKRIIKERFHQTLEIYNDNQQVWIEPTIKRVASDETELTTENENSIVRIEELLGQEKYFIVSAEELFGGTSLAHYICNQQVTLEDKLWIYIDVKTLGPDKVSKIISKELNIFGLQRENVFGVILDSWTRGAKFSLKIIEAAHEAMPHANIAIVESSSASNKLPKERISIKNGITFKNYFLSVLSREKIRSIVEQYYKDRNIDDHDIERALQKLISDLTVLNLHRTAFNCLTLLKAEEVDFDESPVNRTEVIKRILFLLFSAEQLPSYKIRPDLKDCEHTLGWFCEQRIRKDNLIFSLEEFISEIGKFCLENVIKLDLEMLFQILKNNNIIVQNEFGYSFRHLYWVMYFCAQRMHHSTEFKEFIFEDMRYSSYPELIEFYTGIDRRRNDALEVLINDLTNAYMKAKEKCGFPEGMNPYDLAQWNPDGGHIEKLLENFESDIHQSKLPTNLKDQFSDRTYDPKKPYNQDIQTIVKEYLLELLMQLVQAGSRALRNSDYANAEIKKKLMKLIFDCWTLLTKVMLVISPILATQGKATFEGSGFMLVGDFGDTIEKRFQTILRAIPSNIVMRFKDDIYSHKMGPLFFDQIESTIDPLKKHYMIITIIEQRPLGWSDVVKNYIANINKNSYYLFSIHETLYKEITHGFCSNSDERNCTYLLKMTLVKHETGTKNPGKKLIEKVKLNFKKHFEN